MLEFIQIRWTRNIDGISDMNYDSRLRSLDLFSVNRRLFRADLIKCWKIVHGKSQDMLNMYLLDTMVGTRGHLLKFIFPPGLFDVCRG